MSSKPAGFPPDVSSSVRFTDRNEFTREAQRLYAPYIARLGKGEAAGGLAPWEGLRRAAGQQAGAPKYRPVKIQTLVRR